MNTKFSTIIYTFTFASLGATIIATKFFDDYNNSLARPLTIGTVALCIASVVSLIGELRKAQACAADRDMDARFDQVWKELRDQRLDLENQMNDANRHYHQRMDQEVDAIHNRFAVLHDTAPRPLVGTNCKKKA